jgi:hypothetical protein
MFLLRTSLLSKFGLVTVLGTVLLVLNISTFASKVEAVVHLVTVNLVLLVVTLSEFSMLATSLR